MDNSGLPTLSSLGHAKNEFSKLKQWEANPKMAPFTIHIWDNNT